MVNDVDAYFQHPASSLERWRTNVALRFALRGCRLRPSEAQGWQPTPTDLVDGAELLEPRPDGQETPIDASTSAVVSTVRMGYGHHRIALGVCSYGAAFDRRALLLDLLASPRDEAKAIRRLDEIYSFMSRITAELGGPFEALWGRLMQSGGIGALRMTFQMAARLTALLDAVPRDVPFVSAYPLNGHLAVRLGFRRVVNLIFDNDPQHFLVVPGALNLVQTTSSYEKLRRLGVPRDEVAYAGHWVSRELVEHVEQDSGTRIRRAEQRAPRRLLVTIGGAGAQRAFVSGYLRALAPLLREGQLKLLLNLGDHQHLHAPFRQQAEQLGVDFSEVAGFAKLQRFCTAHPLDDMADGALPPITLFTFSRHLEAVRATDLLMRVADVLVTKPSELAFVPVPKLHIRRVGDHEAASARRAAELGDGTLECRELDEALRMTKLLVESEELLVPMNERIVQNAARGVYDGSRRAMEIAVQGH